MEYIEPPPSHLRRWLERLSVNVAYASIMLDYTSARDYCAGSRACYRSQQSHSFGTRLKLTSRSRVLANSRYSVAECANPFDHRLHHVAGAQKLWRGAGKADSGGRARCDDVAWLQRGAMRDLRQQRRNVEEHMRCRVVLLDVTVYQQLQPQVRRVGQLVRRHNPRSHRARAI